MKPLLILGYVYAAVAALVALYEVIYLRFIFCTQGSVLGFFWCPETSNMVSISIKALLWPFFYLF